MELMHNNILRAPRVHWVMRVHIMRCPLGDALVALLTCIGLFIPAMAAVKGGAAHVKQDSSLLWASEDTLSGFRL